MRSYSTDHSADSLLDQSDSSSVSDPLGLCEVGGDSNKAWTAIGNLGLAAVCTLFLTTLTFGSGVPAGLFIPSMVGLTVPLLFYRDDREQITGATLGRALGTGVKLLHELNPTWNWQCDHVTGYV